MRKIQIAKTGIVKTGVVSAICLALFTGVAGASSPPPAPTPKPSGPPPKPSALTGNALPQCKEGEYIGGMICKIAPPGYYLEHGMKYPAPCPKGMTSPAGSKAKSYCK